MLFRSMKPDGSDMRLISEGLKPYHMNYSDGTIYYVNAADGGTFAADSNGGNARQMSKDSIQLIFLQDKIFSSKLFGNDSFNMISADGTNVTPIFEIEKAEKPRSLWNATAGTDMIYFLRKDGSGIPSTLYAMQPDGSNVIELLSHTDGTMRDLVWHNDMLYYVLTVQKEGDTQRTISLRRCAPDGSKDHELIASFDGYYNIDGDTVFYSTSTGFIRHSLNTSAEQEISLDADLNSIDICDGRLYYVISRGVHPNGVQRPTYMGRVLLDGGEHQIFDPSTKAWVSANEAPQIGRAHV